MAISDYCQMIVSSLKIHLEFAKEDLRKVQVSGFEKLIDFVASGKLNGLVKHPTGAGKTRFFSEVLAAINLPSLILVPRVNLVFDTKDSLVGDEMKDEEGIGYLDEEVILLSDESGNASSSLKNIHDKITKAENFNGVVIMTYQSFLKIYQNDQHLLDMFMKIIKVIISDESHKSLGDKTQESIKRYVSDIIDSQYEMLHIHTTATPQIDQKGVCDTYDVDVIDWVRVQDSVEDGILIMPQFRHVGTATYKTSDNIHLTDNFFDKLAESEKFVMSNGQSVIETVVDEYITLKNKHHGYLPGVVFCSTIFHAEMTCQYLESRGIKAIRCTSANNQFDCGTSPQDARRLFHNECIDLVVTVHKVGEGWDVPTLRCALWLKPVRTSSIFIQGTGRVMRTLLLDTIHRAKDRSNTYVIEPIWELVRVTGSKSKEGHAEKNVAIGLGGVNEDSNICVHPIKNGYEHFVESGEYNIDAIKKIVGNDIVRIHLSLDFHNDDHLRLLIGGPEKLIINGKGIYLRKEVFSYSKYEWTASCHRIAFVLFGIGFLGCKESEVIAKRLWPDSHGVIDFYNDDHLRLLIGGPEKLVVNGRGTNLMGQTFICEKKKWKISGIVVGDRCFSNRSVGCKESEILAKRLWPDSHGVIDLQNDDHLRLLIGGSEKLVVNGKGVNLNKHTFVNSEFRWNISGGSISRALFNKSNPGRKESEKIARRLWSEEMKVILPVEDFDIHNDDHLRLLIGGSENLIVNGRGTSISLKVFSNEQFGWKIRGEVLCRKLLNGAHGSSADAETLAKRLWPDSHGIIDLHNDYHLRLLLGEPEDLMTRFGFANLASRTFISKEHGWKITGYAIGMALFNKRPAGSKETKELVRRLWPNKFEKLRKK